jgi:hypothetical protein
MGFGTPPTVLEGDYSTWTIYDTVVGYRPVDWAFLIDKNEAKIIFYDITAYKVRSYDIALKTVSDALFTIYHPFGSGICADKSICGTYIVARDEGDNVYVFKNGELIKTISGEELGIEGIEAVGISPKGKYIVVGGYLTEAEDSGFVVLVGS